MAKRSFWRCAPEYKNSDRFENLFSSSIASIYVENRRTDWILKIVQILHSEVAEPIADTLHYYCAAENDNIGSNWFFELMQLKKKIHNE